MIATIKSRRQEATMAKKKAARRGRPPASDEERLDHEMTIRFSSVSHLPLLEAAAERENKPVRVFVRDAAIETARRLVGKQV